MSKKCIIFTGYGVGKKNAKSTIKIQWYVSYMPCKKRNLNMV